MMTDQLHKFFQLCAPDGSSGAVDRDSFRHLCNRFEISDRDADGIFDDLDHDRDGLITFDDFARGFSDYVNSAGMADSEPESSTTNHTTAHPVPTEISHESGTLEVVVVADTADHHQQHGAAHGDLNEKHHDWEALTKEAEFLGENSKGERLKWLLDELQSSEKKHLVPYLENAVEELLSNLHRLQEDNQKLEESWKREKLEHERHVKLMADEMDNQVKETEMRLRLKAQTDVEDERKSLQTKMDAEMDNLQAHLVLFDKVNSWLQTQPPDSYDARFDEVRNKMTEAVSENRQLRINLLDTQTSIALMRSELMQLRTLYEEKCRELSSEREKILEVLHEQDHLSRQLSLLHEANRRLQDTNDVLRNNFDSPASNNDRCDMKREKSGSIIGDYMEAKCTHCYSSQNASKEDLEETKNPEYLDDFTILRRARSMDIYFPTYRKTNTRTVKRFYDSRDPSDQDEGFSSTPESSLLVKDEDISYDEHHSKDSSSNFSKPLSSSTPHKSPLLKCESISEDVVLECESTVRVQDDATGDGKSMSRADLLLDDRHQDDQLPKKRISDIIKQLGFQEELIRNYSPTKRSLEKCVSESATSRTLGLKSAPDNMDVNWKQRKVLGISQCQTHPLQSNVSHQQVGDQRDSLMTSMDEEALFAPDGPPQKMFNVIFIGDAGVGKSSFALRISKGVFTRHMSATLGVDFLMRTIKVDDFNIELRLWDTAGQERFRSVTTSYFRKADGVMLLYDCTCEHSFLNVRQWVKDVDTITDQTIPLMIVGNKVDLRPTLQRSGKTCISTQQGERLAKDCGAAFVEASAKDGTNVMPSLVNLVRCMLELRGLRSRRSTMQLSDGRQKKGCCGK